MTNNGVKVQGVKSSNVNIKVNIFNISDLPAMRDTDVCSIDPVELVDIRDVTVNTSLPKEERLLNYLDQIKNPYCFKHGKTVVKVSFADTHVTLEDRLEKYLLSL